jgi:multidrug resistance efflux pump
LAISDESSRERLTHRQFERPPPISRRWRIARPPSPNLDWTIVRAPVNGFVTNLTLDVGQFASVGTKVMALIDSDSYRVTGYFEETKIPIAKRSGHVDIFLMSGGPPLRGHVESISRGITDRDNPAGPGLLANVNPTFEWVRLAQRIPVRISHRS